MTVAPQLDSQPNDAAPAGPPARRAYGGVASLVLLCAAVTAMAIGVREALFARVAIVHLLSLVALAPLAVVVTIAVELLALRRSVPCHRPLLYTALGVALFAPSAFGVAGRSARGVTFEKVRERGAPIVAAVAQYKAEHGAPPETLEQLVPQYLPALPTPGVPSHPSFSYVYDDGAPRDLKDAPVRYLPWLPPSDTAHPPRFWLFIGRADAACAELYGYSSETGRWDNL